MERRAKGRGSRLLRPSCQRRRRRPEAPLAILIKLNKEARGSEEAIKESREEIFELIFDLLPLLGRERRRREPLFERASEELRLSGALEGDFRPGAIKGSDLSH
jgi:hypothetical protein